MFNKDGRPKIANFVWGIAMVLLVLLIYLLFVPFDFVFKDDSGVVFIQRGVTLVDFKVDEDDSGDSEAVYGENAADYYYAFDEKNVKFSDSDFDIRKKMICLAVKNLISFKWDRENFAIEMNAR